MAHETSDGKRWLSIEQARAFYGVSRRTVYVWISAGKITAKRTPGGGQRVLVDVRAWEGGQNGETDAGR